MADALIGYTGYVGTTLLRQRAFDFLFRSTNIDDVAGREYDVVVCAGAPAKKWVANNDPRADRAQIARLMENLEGVKCRYFVLISTVDVFSSPLQVDESSAVQEQGLHAYGRHRRELERFVEDTFPVHSVIRLPGLVGPGLKKNVIYDFKNDNGLDKIDSRALFQFYPMVNLWADIQVVLREKLPLVHLTAEPISVAEVASDGCGRKFSRTSTGPVAEYDMQTRYADAFGSPGRYQYSKKESLTAIRAYFQSEPAVSKGAAST